MKESTRQRLVRNDIWMRALFMVLFAFAFGFARVITGFIVIFQFFTVLITGRVNEPLLLFGKNLAVYIYEILEFQTFNTEIRPFPFSPWPDEEPGGEQWLEEDDLPEEIDDKSDVSESDDDLDNEPGTEPNRDGTEQQ